MARKMAETQRVQMHNLFTIIRNGNVLRRQPVTERFSETEWRVQEFRS